MNVRPSSSQPLRAENSCSAVYLANAVPFMQPGAWVALMEAFTPYSHDEALLLCQHSPDEWVVWIPDHGEAILHYRQFCPV
jgi:hypothetical protein